MNHIQHRPEFHVQHTPECHQQAIDERVMRVTALMELPMRSRGALRERATALASAARGLAELATCANGMNARGNEALIESRDSEHHARRKIVEHVRSIAALERAAHRNEADLRAARAELRARSNALDAAQRRALAAEGETRSARRDLDDLRTLRNSDLAALREQGERLAEAETRATSLEAVLTTYEARLEGERDAHESTRNNLRDALTKIGELEARERETDEQMSVLRQNVNITAESLRMERATVADLCRKLNELEARERPTGETVRQAARILADRVTETPTARELALLVEAATAHVERCTDPDDHPQLVAATTRARALLDGLTYTTDSTIATAEGEPERRFADRVGPFTINASGEIIDGPILVDTTVSAQCRCATVPHLTQDE